MCRCRNLGGRVDLHDFGRPRLEPDLRRIPQHATRGLCDGRAKAMLHPGQQKRILDPDRHLVVGDFDRGRSLEPMFESLRSDKLFDLLKHLAFRRDRRLHQRRGIGLHRATPSCGAHFSLSPGNPVRLTHSSRNQTSNAARPSRFARRLSAFIQRGSPKRPQHSVAACDAVDGEEARSVRV